MLVEVLDDSETLVLAKQSTRGVATSKWSVEPGYNPTVCTWIPTATIEVTLVDANSPWPYEIMNTEESVSVRARRTKSKRSRSEPRP